MSIFKPFSTQLWLTILGLVLLSGILIFVFEVSTAEWDDQQGGEPPHSSSFFLPCRPVNIDKGSS